MSSSLKVFLYYEIHTELLNQKILIQTWRLLCNAYLRLKILVCFPLKEFTIKI